MEFAPEVTFETADVLTVFLLQMLPLIVVFVFCLIGGIICGVFCKKLAKHKGYTGYFWTGFFFSWMGLIYVHGLPDLNLRKDLRAVMKRMVSNDDRVTRLEDQQFTRQY